MKRRGFLQALGIGAGAAVLAPSLLFSLEIEKNSDSPLSDIETYPGKNGESFFVSFKDKFYPGDVLSYDPEYGDQLIVINSDNFPEHEVKMVTNDKEHYFKPYNLAKGITYIQISRYFPGEYGTHYSGSWPVNKSIETTII